MQIMTESRSFQSEPRNKASERGDEIKGQVLTLPIELPRRQKLLLSAVLLLFCVSHLCQPQTTSPQSPLVGSENPIQSADELIKHGHEKDAIDALLKLAESMPAKQGVQRELGIAYYRLGQLKDAESRFKAAMLDDPADLESVQMRGLTLYRLNRRSEALPFLERAFQWMPDSPIDVSYVLGRCYIDANRLADARATFARQYSLDPQAGAAHLLLAQMLIREDLPDIASEEAKRAIEISPGIALAHFVLGKIYLAKGNPDEAFKQFSLEIKINPTYPPVYEFLGDLYIRTNQYKEAQKELTKALSLDQSNTGPFILMGKLFLTDNDPQTAATYLEHAEQMDASNYITHYLLAQAYRQMKKMEDAKREFTIVSRMHSEQAPGEPPR